MGMTKWGPIRLLSVTLLGLTLSACTVSTDPFKPTSDSTASTSGSSSSKPTALTDEEKVSIFAAANFDRLKEDMAAGRGEHLASLATLLGVPQDRQPEFFSFTKTHFSVLYPSEHATSDEMIASLTREMSTHPQFRTRIEQPS